MDIAFPGRTPRRGFDEAYRQSFDMATLQLRGTDDLAALCRRSGSTLTNEDGVRAVALYYMGRRCNVLFPAVEITTEAGEPLSIRDKLLILHYLNTADGSQFTGRPVTFQELPEGAVYYPTFVKRAVKPVLNKFSDRAESLLSAAEQLGGVRADTGDFSFRLKTLPRVTLTFTLWLGDEELPPEASMLFDSSITSYLPTEDITVLCEILAWKLVKLG